MKKDTLFRAMNGIGAVANIASEFIPFTSPYRLALKGVSFACNLSSAAIANRGDDIPGVLQGIRQIFIPSYKTMSTQAGFSLACCLTELWEMHAVIMTEPKPFIKGIDRGADGVVALNQLFNVYSGISKEKSQQQKLDELKP